MSRLPPLDMREAHWDKMRDAVVIPAGRDQVVVTRDALEAHVNRSLSHVEALEAAADEMALLRHVANSVGGHDGVITITHSALNGRDWSVAAHDADAEEAEPGLAERALEGERP